MTKRRRLKLTEAKLPDVLQPYPFISGVTNNSLIYEKYERFIFMPRDQIFQLVREGKINIAQTQFIESPEGELLDQETIQEKLMEIKYKEVREDWKAHKKEAQKIEKKYGTEMLWIKTPYLPCSWMKPEEGHKTKREKWVAERLQQHLGQETRFFEIYNFLDNEIDDKGKLSFDEKYIGHQDYAIIKADSVFYEKAVHFLNLGQKKISEGSIRKYIQQFTELGILVHLQSGRGHGRESLYAIGYWVTYSVGFSRVQRFLVKDKPGIKALLDFSL